MIEVKQRRDPCRVLINPGACPSGFLLALGANAPALSRINTEPPPWSEGGCTMTSSVDSERLRAAGEPFDTASLPADLVDALRRAKRRRGAAACVLEDHTGARLSYDQLLDRAYTLGARLAALTAPGEVVGVMLPTSVAAIISFFALHTARLTPAMLNFAAGPSNVRAACALAGVGLVVTSQRFLKEADLEGLAAELASSCTILALEDLRETISWSERLVGFLLSRTPIRIETAARGNEPAAILFTSGTTGAPKAVVLSHANLLANVEQCRLHGEFEPDWVFFNTLPVFHAFGLTAGALLPLLIGLKTVLYPSPLHHERIPKLMRERGASVLISTDAFAHSYARAARAGELQGLKYAVLGGERVREETRQAYARFGAAVLEGYGATECAPVVAVNRPRASRAGTVGTLLPGMEARLEPVAGVGQGGRLYLRGPNVMLGYLTADGVITAPPEGWFDTGDLATLSADGFLTIVGRLKRFARIGAEFISLEAVEAHARALWPNARHAALVTRAARGGEEIVLVTDQPDASPEALRAWVKAHGLRAIEAPRRVLASVTVPTLAMGKIDYEAARSLAEPADAEQGAAPVHENGASGAQASVRTT
jgi:acyl-[acyl-carrier-protein]-phospholipid O-acyltransferase / long-chain-fatty-acid--[acyl-carrier-protein] ligase